jgi:predicted amidophosphoribosyltransferase
VNALAELLAIVAPPGCVSCRAPTAAGERLCPACTRALPWLRRACPLCALPRHRGRGCPAAHAAFSRAWAPMAYEGVARELVAALKFRAALPVADLMAAHMAANLPAPLRRSPPEIGAAPRPGLALPPAIAAARWPSPKIGAAWPPGAASPLGGVPEIGAAWPPGAASPPGGGPEIAAARPPGPAPPPAAVAVIVPVPTVKSRRRGRGFDPAGVLAAALARRLDRPLAACLERRDRAPRQVGAGRKARRAHGRLAFVAHAPPPLVLLVDDVHTTGATLDAAARALAAEGTTVVAALSYARTL